MKRFMKMMVAFAIMACAVGAYAQAPYAPLGKNSVTAGPQVAYTNVVDYGTAYKSVDKLVFENDSSVSVTFVTYVVDDAVWTQINSSTVTTGSSVVVYPTRSYTETNYGWVGTSSSVQAVTNTITKLGNYYATKVATIATLGGTNGIAKVDALKFKVYAK